MTQENRARNCRSEWQLSREAWGAAEILRAADSQRAALGRYYYASFYAARAALMSQGVEVRTHSGVRSQFSLLFIKTGLVPPHLARSLAALQQTREDADYSSQPLETDVEEVRTVAQEVCATVERLLRQQSLVSD